MSDSAVGHLTEMARRLDVPLARTVPEWSVSEVSRQTSISIDTLRYCERLGLIDPVFRTSGGRCLYSDPEVERICYVCRLRATGMRTEKAAECLRLRRYPLPEPPHDTVELDLGAPKETTLGKRRGRSSRETRVVVSANGGALDADVVRRILAADPRFNVPASVQKKLKLNKDVVYKQEVDMKFEVKITRVQMATRYVTATDQEAAAEKIRAQMEEDPCRMYANYKTVGTEIEVTRVEEKRTVTPLRIDREGPLLISLADAARATGIGYSQLGQLAAQGGIEQVKVGNRRYLKRESLLEFIDRNTYRGWAY